MGHPPSAIVRKRKETHQPTVKASQHFIVFMNMQNNEENEVTAEEVALQAMEAARTNLAQSPRHLDTTYAREIHYYEDWVFKMREDNRVPQDGPKLTRENVDLYFHTEVTERSLNHNSARRVVNALQRYADDFEFVGHPERFVIDDSQNVLQAIECLDRQAAARAAASLADPHENLPTDMLTESDKTRFMEYVLSNPNLNWEDLIVSFTSCEQMMVRNHSLRQFLLSDLCFNNTHVPNQEGPHDNGMLSIIYRKGGVHKDRQARTRVLGCWRSKNFMLCSTGMLSMVMFYRYYSDHELHFRRPNLEEKPDWWSIPIIQGWNSTQSARTAYTTVFDALNIVWAKCTHLRKAGTEYASAIGALSPN